MTENTFNTEELNSSINSPQYYVDDDGSFKFISPVLSSSNFDGSVPVFEGSASVSELISGMYIQIEGTDFFPIVNISKDDPGLEDSPSTDVVISYLDDQNEVQAAVYDLSDVVTVRYEDWDEKYLGTQGWLLTYGGNAIFSNVAVRGRIEAEEGFLSGLEVTGNINIGDDPGTPGNPGIVINQNGIFAYDSAENETFSITASTGTVVIGSGGGGLGLEQLEDYLGSASYITGPNLSNPGQTIINGGNITTGVINANLITSGSVTGRVVRSNSSMTPSSGTGVYLDGNGNVRFANSNAALTFDSSGLTISGTSINVLGYATDGELSSGLNGKISNGDAASDIITNSTTITGGNISTGNIKSGGYSGPGTGSAFSSLGMLINLDHGSLAAPNFRIDKDGFSFFKGQVTSTGLIIEGGSSPFAYTRNISGTQSPQSDFYSILSLDGRDIFLKAATGDPAKIRWIDSSSRQRATIGWEVSDDEGGEGTANPNTLVVRANSIDSSPADTPGQILIHAQGEGSSINLKTGTNGAVTINGEPIETPGTITNRYKNGTDSPNNGNTIKYGTSTTLPTGAAQGDIYLRYV